MPKKLEVFSFTSKLGSKKLKDENGEVVNCYVDLPGLNFAISRKKLASVEAEPGDEIVIGKLASDMTYHGDGIVSLLNKTKSLHATIKDWEYGEKENKEKRMAA